MWRRQNRTKADFSPTTAVLRSPRAFRPDAYTVLLYVVKGWFYIFSFLLFLRSLNSFISFMSFFYFFCRYMEYFFTLMFLLLCLNVYIFLFLPLPVGINGMNLRRAEPYGIEDLTLKSLCIRGNRSPAPPAWTAPRGAILNRLKATPLIKYILSL